MMEDELASDLIEVCYVAEAPRNSHQTYLVQPLARLGERTSELDENSQRTRLI